jgi:hypothetical protein
MKVLWFGGVRSGQVGCGKVGYKGLSAEMRIAWEEEAKK